MKTVGIVGGGSFGQLLAEKLDGKVEVLLSSRSRQTRWSASLAEVAQADYLILAIPLTAYAAVLSELKSHLGSQTIIVDVCSVKVEPIELIRQILPDVKVVATHPLFGPESAAQSVQDHTVVLCPDVSDQEELAVIEVFVQSLGLKIVRMSAEEHDAQMAVVQGLTFFIARALKNTGIHQQKLETPSFRRLLHLAELEEHHSDDLFYTIQNGNPQTKAAREAFTQALVDLNAQIREREA